LAASFNLSSSPLDSPPLISISPLLFVYYLSIVVEVLLSLLTYRGDLVLLYLVSEDHSGVFHKLHPHYIVQVGLRLAKHNTKHMRLSILVSELPSL
jgi:hypothetical protein